MTCWKPWGSRRSRRMTPGRVFADTAEVGPKVANCISLFSMGKIDSFPIDVWVRKVMHQLYGIEEKNVKAMAEFAAERFCPYGGIAQQYLFYYITHHEEDGQL